MVTGVRFLWRHRPPWRITLSANPLVIFSIIFNYQNKIQTAYNTNVMRICSLMLLVLIMFFGGCWENAKSGIENKSINKETVAESPVIIEIIEGKTGELNSDTLKQFIKQNSADNIEFYQWNNHYVVFGNISDAETTTQQIISKYPNSKVKLYDDMFYEFDKRKRCSDTTIAREWNDIILTANMVNDTSLQNEYLEYHATQFEKWSEVSKGFCNAEFQRLLVYKNGRQLMLVITIPAHKTLDELNPKTTENNPRVDEWNSLMKKYQEGIEGTKKGETWVFLEKR